MGIGRSSSEARGLPAIEALFLGRIWNVGVLSVENQNSCMYGRVRFEIYSI